MDILMVLLFLVATVSLGILAGYWLFLQYSAILLIVFYHRKYKTEDKYLDLYDCLDGEIHFTLMKEGRHTAQEYSEYLLRHQEARQYAYGYYVELINQYKSTLKSSTRRLLLVALLFNIFSPIFLISTVFVFFGLIVYVRYFKQHKASLYIHILHSKILDRYNSSENLIFYDIPDSIESTKEQKKSKLFNEIMSIEEKFWRPPDQGTGHIKKHFAPNGLFVMPTPDGTWKYLTKQEYIDSQPGGDGAQDVYHNIKDIKFNKVDKDIVVVSYWLTAIYESGRDYRVLICSTYKKNKKGVWQQLVHQQEYAKF